MRGRWLALLAPLFLGGCNKESALNPGGPAAEKIAGLGWFVIGTFLLVALAMWILIALVATRPRGSFAEHAPVDVGGGRGWVLVGGFLIPGVILLVVFVIGLASMSAFPMHDGMATTPAEIRIIGHQWWWEVEYVDPQVDRRVTTANEIHIPAGRPVDIDLTSNDVIHSFWVPSLHGKVDSIPGQMNRIRIQADHPGDYPGRCAEYCGAQHANMDLLVVADSTDNYQKWLDGQRADAAAPADQEQTEGQQLFLSHPCIVCHTVRGTLASARVGPDLTHFGSRRGLAANMLENNPANLEAWVTHAQALKPAAAMPDIPQFTGEQARALVAYLRHLR